MDLFDKLKELHEEGLKQINKAKDEKTLNDVRVELVGRKGCLLYTSDAADDVYQV